MAVIRERKPGAEARSKTNKERNIRPGRSPHGLQLNVEVFDKFMAGRKQTTREEVARYMRIGASTLDAARTKGPINEPFISALLKVIQDSRHSLNDFLIPIEKDTTLAAA